MGRRRDEETRSDNRGKERSTKRHRDDGSDSKKEKRRKRSRSRSSSSSSSDSLADERRKRDRKEKDRRHHRHKRDRERESRNERRRSRSRKRESRVNEDSGPKSGSNETEKGRFANSGKNDRMDTGSSSQNQNNDDAVDDETRRIEIAMQRRRERLEQWRREKQLDTKGGDEQHKSAGGAHPATSAAASGADAEKREALDLIKAWSFENDDEDDDDQIQAPLETAVSGDVNGSTTHSSATPSVASNKDKDKHVPVTSQEPDAASEANATLMESEESKPSTQNVAPTSTKRIVAIDDEVDPLDAYMMEVNREVSGLLRKVQKAQQVTTVRDTKNTTTDGLLTARAPVAKVIRIVTKAEQAAKSTPAGENDNETQMAATNSRTDAEEGGSKKLLIAKRPGFASNSNSRVKGEDESLDESVKQKKAKMAKRMPSDDEDGDAKDDDDEDALRALVTNSDARKVKLNKVDHSQVEYPPFRKAFYVETHEIAQMNAEGVLQLRTELDGIRVTGRKCPKPIRAWSQAGVNVRVLQVLKEAGFERPTPIQAQALPIIMCGRDLIGIAKTGSGKTLAFLLPLFRHALDQPPLEAGDGPIGLIMTPTRELAVQICRDSRPFARALNLRAVAVYGGTGISEQIAELKRGAEIVVATPGRLIDLLAANGGRVTNLRRVTYVVLDEADRMFDLGFEPQVMRILENVRPDRQCVMFSATFPIQMEILARKTLQKPIEVQVGGRSVVCNDVEQLVFVLEEGQKFLKLLELLGVHQELGSVIVFVEKQEHADELLSALLKHGYTCLALHGGLDQYDRDSVIDDFKKGIVRLLVATSVAARGLDVKHLCLVVNYDPPNHYEDYVHRCGRTGRAGNKGVACTFVTPADERHSGEIIRALQASAATVPAELQRLFDSYKQRMEAAGRKVKVGGSAGFTRGKGFKFDEREKELTDVKRRLQTVALGLADEADLGLGLDQTSEGAARTEQIDAAIEGRFTEIRMNDGTNSTNSNSTNAGASASASSGAAASNAAATGGPLTPAQFGRGFTSQPASSTAEVQQKLELARQTAAQIAAAKQQDALERNVEAVHSAADLKNKKTAAALTAEKLNEKLGYRTVQTTAELAAQNATLGTSQPGTSSDAQAVNESDADYYERLQREAASRQKQDERFSTEFEINDFPEYIRMKLCTRKVLTQIEEYCDVCITVKGVFVPPKRAPKEGERKLYLTVEANREFNIMSAKHELIRLIKEEGLRQKSTFQAINKGRYKVV